MCKTESDEKQFGLCDDLSPAKNPAYIDSVSPEKWISVVHNPNRKQVSFYAVDHCVDVLRTDGKEENKCDGILQYEANLLFIELKERAGSGWLGDASNQLSITHRKFSENHDMSTLNVVEAYVCNKLRPIANANYTSTIQKFKNDTGLILRVQRDIHL